MASPNDFINIVNKQGDLLRTNRFTVNITGPNGLRNPVPGLPNISNIRGLERDLGILCRNIEIPGVTYPTKQFSVYGPERTYVTGDRNHTKLNTVFLLPESNIIYDYFDRWNNLMHNNRNHDVGYYDNYIGTISISFYSVTGRFLREVKITEVFPETITQVQLGHDPLTAFPAVSIIWGWFKVV